ncbi:MAG: DUF1565 domain-containing protein [Phycisphaerae bacterium]|nr:DUF1565 domain-containing protein [Phycisphaerae bacterium]
MRPFNAVAVRFVAMVLAGFGTACGDAATQTAQRRVWHVAQTAEASDENDGTAQTPLRTIGQAAQLAQPGDTVLVHEGVYREWVQPARGGDGPDRMIAYQAAEGERVVISGSEVFDPPWEPVEPNQPRWEHVVRANLPEDLFEPHPRLADDNGQPQRYNPFNTPVRIGPYLTAEERMAPRDPNRAGFPELVVGEVFVRGRPMRQVRTTDQVKATPGSWCAADDGKTLVVNFLSWTKGPVEVTVRPAVFAPERRGLGYIRLEGFIIEHAANQAPFPQAGMVSTRSGHHWIIEDNVIRHAATAGLDVGSEVVAHWRVLQNQDIDEGPWADERARPVHETKLPEGPWPPEYNYVEAPAPSHSHVVRNNRICDNSLSGLIAVKADDLLIEGNTFERNNRRRLTPSENPDLEWVEAAAIKLHVTRRARIARNLIRDQAGSGSGIWLDNTNEAARITGNLVLGNDVGIDLEINAGPPILIDHNVVAFNRIDGLSSRCSVTVRFVHNLSMYNGRWGCIVDYAGTRGQFFGRRFVRPTGCEVRNNVFVGNQRGAIRFPIPKEETERKANRIDGNVVEPGQLFQLSGNANDAPSPEEMANLAKAWLDEAGVAKALWPDFDQWRTVDAWPRGCCNLETFAAAFGGPAARAMELGLPRLWEVTTRIPSEDPARYPEQGSTVEGLDPQYKIEFRDPGWQDVLVDPVADATEDFFGQTPPDGKVPAGPFGTASLQSQRLWLWPPSF